MRNLLIITLTLIVNISFAQSVDIWTKQSKVSEVIDFEKALIDEVKILNRKVYLSKSSFPLVDNFNISKPIIFERETNNFLPVYAEYYFSKEDSILRYISYDWEKNRYGNLNDKKLIWEEEKSKLEEYNLEFERIKIFLTEKFGRPKKQDKKPIKTKSMWGNSDYLSRETIWDNSLYYAKQSLVFADNTFRIRLNFYWK